MGASPTPPQPLRAVQVFVALSQRPDQASRHEYLKTRSGRTVEGAGHIEAVLPRSYYDTSVPDSNPVVVLLQMSPGRKVVCGLPRLPTPESLEEMAEGTSAAFRGNLVDFQDWGEWSTLYLSECSMHRR